MFGRSRAEVLVMSRSENGWPAIASNSSSLLYTWVLPVADHEKDYVHLRCHRGSAGFVLCHCAMRWDGMIEDIDGGIVDDWGWAFRPVRGYSTVLSNHSSGTALDLDAIKHPLGRDTFDDADTATMHKLLKIYDGTIRWGGDYHNRLDQMHIELDDGVTMADVERVAKKLMKTPRGQRLLAANPSQKVVILS